MVRALEELEGVKNARASFPEKRAVVVFDRQAIQPEQMCRALFKAGFPAAFDES